MDRWHGGRIAAAIERPELPDMSGLRHPVNDRLTARSGAGGTARRGGLEPGLPGPSPRRTRWSSAAPRAANRTTLADQLHALAAPDDGFAPVEVFVGPPGAGKTTTIAKVPRSNACAKAAGWVRPPTAIASAPSSSCGSTPGDWRAAHRGALGGRARSRARHRRRPI
jgi:hypothetical protein